MPFSYTQLTRLNLKRNEWVVFKYKGFDDLDSGQVGTSSTFYLHEPPIFDEDQQHIYIQLPRHNHSSKLAIANIEYFYRGTDHPWFATWMGKVIGLFGKFQSLNPGVFTVLKTNGDEMAINFIENRFEVCGEYPACFLIHLDGNGKLDKIPYNEILEVFPV
jgi:hypothetical protein